MRRSAEFALVLSLGLWGCSKDSPTQPAGPQVDIVVVSGNGQFGPAGQQLTDPLTVSVARVDDGRPVAGVIVEWSVVDGAGAQLSPSTTETDSTGFATATLRLGGDLGRYGVEARLRSQPERFVELEAWAVLPPELSGLSHGMVEAGQVITLEGANFSPIPSHNIVLFSGIHGSVVAADEARLSVTVPSCLPSRTVSVSVMLGGEASGTLPLEVAASSDVLDLVPGAARTIIVEATPSCVRLAPGSWLAMAQSVSTIGAARFDYRLTGLRQSGVVTEGPPAPAQIVSRATERVIGGESVGRREEWKAFLRDLEAEALRESRTVQPESASSPYSVVRAAAPKADVGDRREFQVVGGDGDFDQITAEVRAISERAVLYVDLEALAGLPLQEVERFGSLFDDPIYSVDVDAFGTTSDVDSNGKVIILFTPKVNRLSTPGSGQYVGGFFFGLDLFTDAENSNASEIFYVMVPDPTGQYGNVQTLDFVRKTVPAVLAHEFQHMIAHNERIIKRGAERPDALWLSEALAQMAEDLVGEALRDRGSPGADEYQRGNYQRANIFLANPGDVSLIVATGQGSLAERGAGWMFVRYLRDQSDSNGVLADLTQTNRTGIDNVEFATGSEWEQLFSDWHSAIALEQQIAIGGPLVERALEYPGVDLVDTFAGSVGSYALRPTLLTVGDFSADGRLWSASGAHFLLGSSTGGLALSLAGSDGGVAPPHAGLRLRLVRLF